MEPMDECLRYAREDNPELTDEQILGQAAKEEAADAALIGAIGSNWGIAPWPVPIYEDDFTAQALALMQDDDLTITEQAARMRQIWLQAPPAQRKKIGQLGEALIVRCLASSPLAVGVNQVGR